MNVTSGSTIKVIQYFRDMGIQHKLWASFGVTLILTAGLAMNMLQGMSGVKTQTSLIENQVQPALVSSLQFNAHLKDAESSLGFYLLSKEMKYLDGYHEQMNEVDAELASLRSNPFISSDQTENSQLKDIEMDIKALRNFNAALISLAVDDTENFPARSFAATEQGALTKQILQNISVLMDAESGLYGEVGRDGIFRAIVDLRYGWMNVSNDSRAFLAYRNQSALDQIKVHRENNERLWKKISGFGDKLELEQEDALTQLKDLSEQYYKGQEKYISIHLSDKWRMDAFVLRNEVGPLLGKISSELEALVDAQMSRIHKSNQDVETIISGKSRQSLGVAFLVVCLIAVFAWSIGRALSKPLKRAVEVADNIADGDLNNNIEVNANDETGHMLHAFSRMQENLRDRIDCERMLADETLRVKSALDAAGANVMMTDINFNILYLNGAAKKMWTAAQNDIRAVQPDFDAENLIGKNVSIFYQAPEFQRDVLVNLTATYKAEITLAECTFSVIATPMNNDAGERMGTVLEWTDRTLEVAIEEEVDEMVLAASRGDLSQRLSVDGKSGFFMALSQGINQLVDVCDHAVEDTVRILGAMSKGDMTQRIEHDFTGAFGDLKRDANTTTAKLVEIVGEIRSSAYKVGSGASEIASGNQNLSRRTESQAASLEETAASMEEMTSTIKQNADNARQANQLSSGAREQAEKGGEVVAQAITAMSEINDSSRKVADITSTIDEIAFQTNLLALNAAVEAARAGEQGRGFAVVASEVRNLAQRSAEAAKEIKLLIQDSVSKVEEGSQLVNDSGETLGGIVESVKKVSDIIAEIAAASQEQALGIDQVNRSITQLDDTTQQNAALVEEATAASTSMQDQAQKLATMMDFFDVGDGKTSDASVATVTVSEPPVSSERRGLARAFASKPTTKATEPVTSVATGTDSGWEEF